MATQDAIEVAVVDVRTGQKVASRDRIVVGMDVDADLALERAVWHDLPDRLFTVAIDGDMPVIERAEGVRELRVSGAIVHKSKPLLHDDRIRVGRAGPEFRIEVRRVGGPADARAAEVGGALGSFASPSALVAILAVAALLGIAALTLALLTRRDVGSVARSLGALHDEVHALTTKLQSVSAEVEGLRRLDPAEIYAANEGFVSILKNATGGVLGTGFLIRHENKAYAWFVGGDQIAGEHQAVWKRNGAAEHARAAVRCIPQREEPWCFWALNIGDRPALDPAAAEAGAPAPGSDLHVLHYRVDQAAGEMNAGDAFLRPRVLRASVTRVLPGNERTATRFHLSIAHGGIEGFKENTTVWGGPLAGALVVNGQGRWVGVVIGRRVNTVRGISFVEFEAVTVEEIRRALAVL